MLFVLAVWLLWRVGCFGGLAVCAGPTLQLLPLRIHNNCCSVAALVSPTNTTVVAAETDV